MSAPFSNLSWHAEVDERRRCDGLFLWRRGRLPVLATWSRRDWIVLLFAVFFLAGNFNLYLLGLELISPEATVIVSRCSDARIFATSTQCDT